ncbi:class III lanthionine synthetase LanKC N-terminal domain-containing protein [Streptococcus equi]|uniref:class III lanthionine synthetase LanKC N-terminal domain-containing protein n=1 Tax=Streptococcus equi TaxID=1336 RepID=UPI001D18F20A|nr:hypothetical protein [Streptococcus equi]
MNYKYISKQENILKNFSIFEEITSSGKLVTVYPTTTLQFKEILADLYKIIPNSADGIYILSDHPYRDSNNIFYRYGFLKKYQSTLKMVFLPLLDQMVRFGKITPKLILICPHG